MQFGPCFGKRTCSRGLDVVVGTGVPTLFGGLSDVSTPAIVGAVMSDNLARVPTPEEIGRALRDARRDRGWTQNRVASAAGVHKVTVSRVETGTIAPGAEVLFAIGVAVGFALFMRYLARIVGTGAGMTRA